jgi:hypothetical protein
MSEREIIEAACDILRGCGFAEVADDVYVAMEMMTDTGWGLDEVAS